MAVRGPGACAAQPASPLHPRPLPPAPTYVHSRLPAALPQDLLRPESENLQIRENEGGVFVVGVHQQEVGGAPGARAPGKGARPPPQRGPKQAAAGRCLATPHPHTHPPAPPASCRHLDRSLTSRSPCTCCTWATATAPPPSPRWCAGSGSPAGAAAARPPRRAVQPACACGQPRSLAAASHRCPCPPPPASAHHHRPTAERALEPEPRCGHADRHQAARRGRRRRRCRDPASQGGDGAALCLGQGGGRAGRATGMACLAAAPRHARSWPLPALQPQPTFPTAALQPRWASCSWWTSPARSASKSQSPRACAPTRPSLSTSASPPWACASTRAPTPPPHTSPSATPSSPACCR